MNKDAIECAGGGEEVKGFRIFFELGLKILVAHCWVGLAGLWGAGHRSNRVSIRRGVAILAGGPSFRWPAQN